MDVLVEETGFRLVGGSHGDRRSEFAEDVRAGLSTRPRRVPPRHLYDETGSRLFEAICELPEYYPTRTEASILRRCADELVERMESPTELVELGSGSAEKTRLLLDAFLQAQGRLRYVPIDISAEILERSSRDLRADYDGLEVEAIVGEYVEGLHVLRACEERRDERPHRLALWLGSSVGNLSRAEARDFLGRVSAELAAEDGFLIGIDHRKDPEELVAAYDDAQGVSARFALNLLDRINRELGGDFAPEDFVYRATYDEEAGRVDMHLVCQRPCEVEIEALGERFRFAEGDTIHTESAYKYSAAEIESLADAAGFRVADRWSDERDRFSLNLLLP